MRISQKVKGVLNVKSSTYYFHMKTKILAEFQICISVPLIRTNMAPCFIKFISDSVTKNCKFITKFSFLFEVNKVNLFLFLKYYIPTQVAVVLSSESQYCVMLSHELPSQVPVNWIMTKNDSQSHINKSIDRYRVKCRWSERRENFIFLFVERYQWERHKDN